MTSQDLQPRPAVVLLALLLISACPRPAAADVTHDSGVPVSGRQQSASDGADKKTRGAAALELDKAVERQIDGGETDRYSVELAAGQFMRVVVDQRGVDVTAALLDPQGREIMTVDYSNGTHGPQPVSFVAAASGVYVLKVRKLYKSSSGGPYVITLKELRPATPQDELRVAAERAVIEGTRQIHEGDLPALEEARTKLAGAIGYFKDAGDRYQEALALYMSGLALFMLGETDKALDFYTDSLAAFTIAGDQNGQATALDEIGRVYFTQGMNDQAFAAYDKALALSRAIGDQAHEVAVLVRVGQLYVSMGDKKKALEHYKRALSICEKVKSPDIHAMTLTNMADIYLSSGETTRGLRTNEMALYYYDQAKDKRAAAAVLGRIGRGYYLLGNGQAALEYYNRSLALVKKSGSRYAEHATTNNVAWMRFLLGEKRTALNQLDEALRLAREVKSRRGEADILANMMIVSKALGETSRAILYGKQAVNIYQEVRSQSQAQDAGLQKSFLNSKESVYRTLAELLIKANRLDEAQQVLDLLKEEEYYQYLRRQSKGMFPRAAMTEAEVAAEARASASRDRITAIARAIEELRNKGELDAEEKRLLAELSAKLEAERKVYLKTVEDIKHAPENSTGSGGSGTLARIQQTESLMSTLRDLGNGTVALYTFQSKDKYTVILYTSELPVAREYKIKAETLNRKIIAFRQILKDPTRDPLPAAQELYKIMLAPVASNLAAIKAKTLMWSFDGLLRYVPVAALHDGEKYVAERYQNVVFTPASYARLKDRGGSRGWRALGLGVSRAVGDYPELPGVKEELDGIIRKEGDPEATTGIMPGVILLDDQFTQESMGQALQKKYQVVHIASHFNFEPGGARKSSLLLGDGKYLPIADISNSFGLFDKVELLTLSACNTALGETDAAGAELENFAALAQNKGAKSVTATLWSVADASTSLLMRKFYQLLDDNPWMPKSEALRLAQLSLLYGRDTPTTAAESSRRAQLVAQKQGAQPQGRFDVNSAAPYAHPYYWAPFILIGNWQ